jgi:hypothetical protein
VTACPVIRYFLLEETDRASIRTSTKKLQELGGFLLSSDYFFKIT